MCQSAAMWRAQWIFRVDKPLALGKNWLCIRSLTFKVVPTTSQLFEICGKNEKVTVYCLNIPVSLYEYFTWQFSLSINMCVCENLNTILYITAVFSIGLRHEIFKSAMHLQMRTFPTSRSTGTASRNNHGIGYVKRHSRGKFFLSQFRCRVRYIGRQSPAIKAVRGAVINCIELRRSKGKERDKLRCNHLSINH